MKKSSHEALDSVSSAVVFFFLGALHVSFVLFVTRFYRSEWNVFEFGMEMPDYLCVH
jgi:hypothetical protein